MDFILENIYNWNTIYILIILAYSFYLYDIVPKIHSNFFNIGYIFQYQYFKKAIHFLFWYNGFLLFKQALKYTTEQSRPTKYEGLYNLITKSTGDLDNFTDIAFILGKLSLFIIILYFLFHRSITINYKSKFRDKSSLYYFLNFYLNKLLQLIFLILIEQGIHYAFRFMDFHYFIREMYLLDWDSFGQKITTSSLKQGFYLATFFSLYFTLVQLRYLFEYPGFRYHYTFRYLIYSIISFFGISITLYAVLNTVYNGLSFNSFSNWINTELHNGLITLRVTSIILFYRFYAYFSKKIYDGKFSLSHIVFKMYRTRVGRMGYSDYSSAYFAQLGFYILLIYFLWFFARNSISLIAASILNWGLFFIIDDWVIIHSYSDQFKKILRFDNNKVIGFNIGLSMLLMITLFQIGDIGLIFTAILCISALMVIRYNNIHTVEKV